MGAATAAALAGIADAQFAVLSVLASIVVLRAAVYGYRRVLKIIALPSRII